MRRRYSDFYSLHRLLRDLYPFVNDYEFPGKRLWRGKTEEFREMRMKALEKYLQRVVDSTLLSTCDEVRSFLSEKRYIRGLEEKQVESTVVSPLPRSVTSNRIYQLWYGMSLILFYY